MKKIDIHAHVTAFPDFCPPAPYNNQRFLSAEELLAMYDELGIERGVILPITSPDGEMVVLTNESAAYLSSLYPDRLSWFCNVDPRAMQNTTSSNIDYLLGWYKDHGAKGVGEFTSNLYADDPKSDNLFSHCEEVGLPVLFHISPEPNRFYGIVDDLGLPRLEKMLKKHPDLQFIGHSQPFWSEMSKDNTKGTRNGYPTGKVIPGRLWELMREYGNLCCDLSAGSGANAMMRDTDNAAAFLTEFQDRIYYGCDICASFNRHPFLFRDFLDGLLRDGALTQEAYRKICRDNAAALLGL